MAGDGRTRTTRPTDVSPHGADITGTIASAVVGSSVALFAWSSAAAPGRPPSTGVERSTGLNGAVNGQLASRSRTNPMSRATEHQRDKRISRRRESTLVATPWRLPVPTSPHHGEATRGRAVVSPLRVIPVISAEIGLNWHGGRDYLRPVR